MSYDYYNNFPMRENYSSFGRNNQSSFLDISYNNVNNQFHDISTEKKRNILNYIHTQRKFFEEAKIVNLVQTLNEKHYKLSQLEILPFDKNEKFSIKEIKNIIPKDMFHIARYIGLTTNTDIVSCVLALCSVTSIAMRSRYRIQLDKSWSEMVNLYVMVAKNSGKNKSAIVELLKPPFRNYLLRRRDAANPEKNESLLNAQPPILNAIREIERAIIRNYTNKIRKSGEAPSSMASLMEKLKAHKEDSKQYIIPKKVQEYIFWNVGTSLGLAQRLQNQGETLALMEPEAAMLILKCFKDYSFIELLIKCYGGEQHQYESSIQNRLIDLKTPSLNILLMIQTKIMLNLYKNELLADVGFLPRILAIFASEFAEMSPYPTLPNVTYQNAPEPPECMDLYEEKILNILNFTYTQDKDRELFNISCESRAYSLIKQFQQENTQELQKGHFRHMAPFISKLHGHAVRIAGAIHGWEFPRPHEHLITVTEMQAGITLARFARSHANVAFNTKLRETKHFVTKILEYLVRQDWTRSRPLISSSDLQRNIAGLNKAKCLPALDFLEEHNLIQQHHEPGYAPLCILHPDIFQANLDSLADI